MSRSFALIVLASSASAWNADDVTLQTLETKGEAIHHLGRSLAVRNQTREDGPVMLASGCEVGWRSAVLVFDARLRKSLRAVAVFPSAPSFGAALEWNADELWIGSPNANGGVGAVFVCPDVLGEHARELDAFRGARDFGRAICASDPSEAIANRRVLVGAPSTPNGALKNCGGVAAFDVRDATLRWSVVGERAGERLGSAIEELDDLDGDGVADFAISAPGEVDAWARANTGRVLFVSGASGALIRVCNPAVDAYRGFGASLASIADFDGDGKRDLAIGAPFTQVDVLSPGAVSLISTRTGLELARIDVAKPTGFCGRSNDIRFGWAMATTRDAETPMVERLIVSAPNGVYGGDPFGWVRSWAIPTLRTSDASAWEDAGFRPDRFGAVVRRSGDRRAPFDIVAIGSDSDDEHGGIQVIAPLRPKIVDWEFFGESLR